MHQAAEVGAEAAVDQDVVVVEAAFQLEEVGLGCVEQLVLVHPELDRAHHVDPIVVLVVVVHLVVVVVVAVQLRWPRVRELLDVVVVAAADLRPRRPRQPGVGALVADALLVHVVVAAAVLPQRPHGRQQIAVGLVADGGSQVHVVVVAVVRPQRSRVVGVQAAVVVVLAPFPVEAALQAHGFPSAAFQFPSLNKNIFKL